MVLRQGLPLQTPKVLVSLISSSCDSFYNIPGVAENKNRQAGIGYDRKTNLDVGKDPHNIAPSPDTYNLSSFVELNQTHKKGFSPLYSREVTLVLPRISPL
jgi:hypothetical protein